MLLSIYRELSCINIVELYKHYSLQLQFVDNAHGHVLSKYHKLSVFLFV